MANTTDAPFVVPLAGPLTIATAAAIRTCLLAALERQCDIQVDCAAGTSFDISFVQLLIAARRQAAMQGSTLTLAPDHPSALGDILAEGGFADWTIGTAEGAR
jgi:anti-anti-sigma regulatory factor